MTGQDLKNSILQLAIQGKLVPQNPDDEPASVLLDRIKKEKAQLIKDKKIKKEKPLAEITEEEKPFEIPESWEWVRLGEIITFCGGYAYKSYDFIEKSKYQVLRLGNVKNDYLALSTSPVFINDSLAEQTEKYRCHKNDILITMTGTRKKRDYFFSYQVTDESNHFYINQRVGALRPIDGDVSSYLRYSLKTESVLTDVFQYETGTANQGNLGSENIVKVILPLPPLAEQKRIVAKIEELMPLVEEYDKAQKDLDELNGKLPEQLKQSILQEAIMGKLGTNNPADEPASELLKRIRAEKAQLIKDKKISLSKPEKKFKESLEFPFDLPNNWIWCSLYDVCRVYGRIGFRGYTKGDLVKTKEEGAITISPSNIIDGKLDFRSCTYLSLSKYEESPEIKINKGDVLLVKTASCGKTAIVENLPWKATVNPQIAILKEITIYNKYLAYFLQSPYVQDKIHQFTIGTSIPTFSQEIMLTINVPLPPLAEQHRIVEKLDAMLPKINELCK